MLDLKGEKMAEVKPGVKTSEFWITTSVAAIMAGAALLQGLGVDLYVDEALLLTLATSIAGVYVAGRALVKGLFRPASGG